MVQRAIKLTQGSIHRQEHELFPRTKDYEILRESSTGLLESRSECVWRLDEEQGRLIARGVPADYQEKARQLRSEIYQLGQAKLELEKQLENVPTGFLSRFRRDRLRLREEWQELKSEISASKTALAKELRRDKKDVRRTGKGWYRIDFEPRDKRLSDRRRLSGDYGIELHVYIRPKVFKKAQALQREEPVYLCGWLPRTKDKLEGKFWWYRDRFWISTGYSEEEAKLLLWEKGRREQRKFERLAKAKAAAKEAHEEVGRERIPEEVRLLVWERDGGCCVRCGSTEELEFDHIIPVSKGGSSTEKNVQLLCAKCNREKGDRIA